MGSSQTLQTVVGGGGVCGWLGAGDSTGGNMFDRTILMEGLQNSTLEGVERRKWVGIKPA